MKQSAPVVSEAFAETKFLMMHEIGETRAAAFRVLTAAKEVVATTSWWNRKREAYRVALATITEQEAIIAKASARLAEMYGRLGDADVDVLLAAAERFAERGGMPPPTPPRSASKAPARLPLRKHSSPVRRAP